MKKNKSTKKPIHLLLYGEPGSGKTVFASTFPKCLYFDFDGGTESYREAFPDNLYLTHADGDLISFLGSALEKAQDGTLEYDTIVVDSLTNVENETVMRYRGYDRKDWISSLYGENRQQVTYHQWGNISGSSIALITRMRNLPVNIVIITQIDTITEGEGFTRYRPSLIGKGSLEALHFADAVGFMRTEKNEPVIHFAQSQHDNFFAKARTVKGRIDPIQYPDYDKVYKELFAETNNLKFISKLETKNDQHK